MITAEKLESVALWCYTVGTTSVLHYSHQITQLVLTVTLLSRERTIFVCL